ncbi:hypothetical protein GCM10008018_68300 [Paenibacillus marchantiophytorum]|uniref:Uncharacterized protein n=1 Tax=Paenibacillus marchantiophytorum TaxID=1619310 RepID=A0ABQ1FHQ5_9BACL|nr:DUF5693 family protein [Paenibacillus marchantiophytorum]GGA13752.1 hypothetical protein GCM10008018_68300 [Paenibacillus marchantiophytorum]
MNWYKTWNNPLKNVLWWLVIIGMLGSLPLAFTRHQTETSANQVEFVFDYRDLLDISDIQTNPQSFVAQQLKNMKAAGIQSLAVYESTLAELKESRRIEVYNSRDAAALTQTFGNPNENYTYVLFPDIATQQKLEPLIQKTFTDLQVGVKPWNFRNKTGLVIQMSSDDAAIKTMDPDPITLQTLKDQGFQIVVRLSNRRAFVTNEMDRLLKQLHEFGVKRIIVDGNEVPAYTEEDTELNLNKMADLLHKYDIGLAAIEMLKEPQKGFNTLAKQTNYNVVRLHSFTEKDGEKLMEPLKKAELEGRIQGVADRLVLAVKDRNIRMVFLNAKPLKSLDKGKLVDPLASLYESLQGKDGAIPRIEKAGFTLGPAEAFTVETSGWQKIARVFILIGGVSLIVLAVSFFIPESVLLLFVLGILGAIALHTLSANLYAQGLALATAICAPSVAMMLVIRSVRSGAASKWKSGLAYGLWQLLKTSLISLIGVVFEVVLLNHITYSLVLQQFRGVSALHLLPIAVAGLYLLFFSENNTYGDKIAKVRKIFSSYISVLWIVVAGIILAAGYYYLSRTGNEGQASSVEKLFRSFLENTLGVRPRTKEFLFAHPLFLLGAYLSVRYRNAIYVLFIGVMGQLSIVDTFAHLHTPLHISLIRITYGLVFGALIGIVLIIAWEIITRSWKRWVPQWSK